MFYEICSTFEWKVSLGNFPSLRALSMTLASHSNLKVKFTVTGMCKLLKTSQSSQLNNDPLRGEFAGISPKLGWLKSNDPTTLVLLISG